MLRRTLLVPAAAAAAASASAQFTSSSNSRAQQQQAPPNIPLKSAAEYLAMPNEQLQKLIDKRNEQISELKDLHMKAHNGVEYLHRKQMLDWEEHGVHYAQAASVMTGDTMFETRAMHETVRQKDESEDRDRWLAMWIMVASTIIYWWWLTRHYRERPEAPRGRQQSNIVAFGFFPFSWAGNATTWTSRHIPIAWEAEKQREEQRRENLRFPREEPDEEMMSYSKPSSSSSAAPESSSTTDGENKKKA